MNVNTRRQLARPRPLLALSAALTTASLLGLLLPSPARA